MAVSGEHTPEVLRAVLKYARPAVLDANYRREYSQRMTTPQKKRTLSEEEQRECAALNAIYKAKKKALGITQEMIAIEGLKAKTQSAASHYLTGKNALNVEAAAVFAKYLQVPVEDFSPRLAAEIAEKGLMVHGSALRMSTGTGKTQIARLVTPSSTYQAMAAALSAEEAGRHAKSHSEAAALDVLADLNVIQAKSLTGLIDGNHRLMIKRIREDMEAGRPARAKLWGPAPPSEPHQPVFNQDDYAFVTQYAAGLAAGVGEENAHVEVKGTLAFKRAWIKAKRLNPKSLSVAYGRGDSMSPTIQDGDVLLVDTSCREPISGQLYALKRPDGKDIVKRLELRSVMGKRDKQWYVVSDNPDKESYPDVSFANEPGEELSIIGRIVWRGGDL